MVENREIIFVLVFFRKIRYICGRNFLLVLLNLFFSGVCMSLLDVFVVERYNFCRFFWMKNVGFFNVIFLVWLIWLNGIEGLLLKIFEYRFFIVYVEGGWWDIFIEKVFWS